MTFIYMEEEEREEERKTEEGEKEKEVQEERKEEEGRRRRRKGGEETFAKAHLCQALHTEQSTCIISSAPHGHSTHWVPHLSYSREENAEVPRNAFLRPHILEHIIADP